MLPLMIQGKLKGGMLASVTINPETQVQSEGTGKAGRERLDGNLLGNVHRKLAAAKQKYH